MANAFWCAATTLGDTIQFIRFVLMLRRSAASVTVWAQPSLLPLLQTMKDVGELSPLHDGTPDGDYDADVELMELAHVFRVTPQTLPRDVPYLYVPPSSFGDDETLRVGLVWRSGDWDPRRSLELEQLRSLFTIRGATFYALQANRTTLEHDARLRAVNGVDRPFSTAQAMRALDIVISVDTMTAHLAAALGVQTWTLLPREPDWRWLRSGETTPWYPTMRLFRQRHAGSWEDVIERVREELQRACSG